jgi:hypothetical protein
MGAPEPRFGKSRVFRFPARRFSPQVCGLALKRGILGTRAPNRGSHAPIWGIDRPTGRSLLELMPSRWTTPR